MRISETILQHLYDLKMNLPACLMRSSMYLVLTAVHVLWKSGQSGKPKGVAYASKAVDRLSPFPAACISSRRLK